MASDSNSIKLSSLNMFKSISNLLSTTYVSTLNNSPSKYMFSKEKDPSSIVQEQTWQTIREAQKVTATDPSGFLHGFCRVCNECSWLHQHTMIILTSTPGLSNGTYRIANTRPGNGGFSGHMVCVCDLYLGFLASQHFAPQKNSRFTAAIKF